MLGIVKVLVLSGLARFVLAIVVEGGRRERPENHIIVGRNDTEYVLIFEQVSFIIRAQ